MEANNKANKNKILLMLLIGLLLVSFIGTIYFYKLAKKENEPVEKLLNDYSELEKAYMKTMQELEKSSNSEYDNMGILKQNLKKLLAEIKEEKKRIDENRKKEGRMTLDTTQTQSFKEKLEMSKQVADAILVARLNEVEKQNKQLTKSNSELQEMNVTLETNLKKMKDYYEEQKAKNESLNAAVKYIKEEMDRLKTDGSSNADELVKMKKKKEEYETKLLVSNKTIEAQNKQINQFIESMKKVNLNCYFVFEEGNKEKEAKIYLTSNGISKQYMKYFTTNKPKIHVEFQINKEAFKDGLEKVDLIIFNSNNIEVLGTSKTITSGLQEILISSDIFASGRYSIKLKNGNEDLVIGGEYVVKI